MLIESVQVFFISLDFFPPVKLLSNEILQKLKPSALNKMHRGIFWFVFLS